MRSSRVSRHVPRFLKNVSTKIHNSTSRLSEDRRECFVEKVAQKVTNAVTND